MAKLGDKREMRLEGQEALELYVKAISRQLSAIIGQACELLAVLEEMEQHLPERAVVEGPQTPANEAPGSGNDLTATD